MIYMMWTVYTEQGFGVEYYVINRETKEVQSVWKSLLEAKKVCQCLNKSGMVA